MGRGLTNVLPLVVKFGFRVFVKWKQRYSVMNIFNLTVELWRWSK